MCLIVKTWGAGEQKTPLHVWKLMGKRKINQHAYRLRPQYAKNDPKFVWKTGVNEANGKMPARSLWGRPINGGAFHCYLSEADARHDQHNSKDLVLVRLTVDPEDIVAFGRHSVRRSCQQVCVRRAWLTEQEHERALAGGR